ncbi:MAG: hypothetical protein DRI61_01375 [Chloroflexi bacterium]|nr:MAG: hypothetical protein DRI61_01375 [Chloroflexota bacterium]
MSDFPDGTYPVNVQNATLNVNVTNSTLDVNVKNTSINVVVDSGSIDAHITNASLDVKVLGGSIDANITNSSLNVVVDSGTIDANITNASLDVNVLGGTIDANITNATLDVNVTNSVLNVSVQGQASVSIDNASVYLNVKQDRKGFGWSYLGSAAASGDLGHYRFYYMIIWHGARSVIRSLSVGVKNYDTANDKTLTVRFYLWHDTAALYETTITVEAGFDGTKTIYPYVYWNYDTLIIEIESSDKANVGIYMTTGTKTYYYAVSNTQFAYTISDDLHIQVELRIADSGSIPVSGTVNTINIPNVGSGSGTAATLVAAGSTVTLKEIEGMGTVHMVIVRIDDDMGEIRFYVDGELIQYSNSSFTLRPSEINLWDNYDSSRYIRRVLWDATSPRYLIEWTCPLQFKKSFKIEAYNPRSYDVYFAVEYLVYNKVS